MDSTKLTGKTRCPDCVQCQMCSSSRCRACRKGDHVSRAPELGTSFTHGDYLRWKRDRDKCRAAADPVQTRSPKRIKRDM